MGLNVGGLYVRADGVTRANWTERGVTRNDEGALQLSPLSLEKTGRLGFVVSEPAEGWIAVYDSERYRADNELGKHLADTLGVGVAHYEMSGASDHAFYALYGKGPKLKGESWDDVEEFVVTTFPYAFLYYNKLESTEGLEVIGFEGIGSRCITDGGEGARACALQVQGRHREGIRALRYARADGVRQLI